MTMVLIPEKFFIHLLGKTGTGKSATGNSIVGRKVFNCKSSTSAVTKCIQLENGHLGAREVEVVDGPGLVDVNTGVSDIAIQGFKKVVEANKDSVHIFLLIWRYGDPFSTDDQAMVDAMRKEFGPSVFSNHGIIVMTCGDNFRADTEDEGITFDSWCKDQTGTFARLLKECQSRVVLIENSRPMSKGGDAEAVFKLAKLVDALDYNSATGVSLDKRRGSNALGTIKSWFIQFRYPIAALTATAYLIWSLYSRYFSSPSSLPHSGQSALPDNVNPRQFAPPDIVSNVSALLNNKTKH